MQLNSKKYQRVTGLLRKLAKGGRKKKKRKKGKGNLLVKMFLNIQRIVNIPLLLIFDTCL